MSIRRHLLPAARRPFDVLTRRRAPAPPLPEAAAQSGAPAEQPPSADPQRAALEKLAAARREREEQVLAARAGAVRHGEHLAEPRADLLPGPRRDENLAEVSDALRAAGIGHGLVPDGRPRHRLAIGPGERPAVLAALATAFAGQPVYADLLEHGRTLGTVLVEQLPSAVAAVEVPAGGECGAAGTGGPEGTGAAEGPAADGTAADGPAADRAAAGEAGPPPADRVKGVRIYRPALVGTMLYGPETGCDVEFWDSAAPSAGAIASIDETPFGWWVPSLAATATTRIAGRSYPLVDAFATALPDQVDFLVDAVITWVDDADPAWRRRRALARAALTGSAGADGSAGANRTDGAAARGVSGDADQRFRSRDELRYCLRSIAAYAPWIRRVFLVTDDQVPHWLADGVPGLTVVSHRELFAGSGAGPVFNSHAIETRLHLIPGLAEHFLYFNDDMFLGRPLSPQAFFLGNGLPRYFPDGRVIPPGAAHDGDSVYVAAQKNTRAALASAVGRTYPRTLKHTPYPLRRSVLAEAAERFSGVLAGTVRSPFRSAADLAPITLATHYADATARAVEGHLYDGYFATDSREDLAGLPELDAARWADVFCLADGVRDGIPAEEQERIVTEFLNGYFPAPSPWERPAAAAARAA
ncbi:stealth conserved region 3 domain-containing protein [Kitasatospora sp. NPDC054939]